MVVGNGLPSKRSIDLHQAVLVVALDGSLQVPHPGALPVALSPGRHGFAQPMELNAALELAGPDVPQGATQLGVPQERRKVVDRDRHADVVDRAVRDRADRDVGERPAPEQPDVARRGGRNRVVESEDRIVHEP